MPSSATCGPCWNWPASPISWAAPRTLCEAYGAGGWDLRFEDMKRIGDWIYVLGVNTLDEHLSYITIRGARKRDHPQSFSYHEPWWDDYHVMADYFTRLSLVLSSGQQINRILVLEPTTTSWMYQSEPQLGELGKQFQDLVTTLAKRQVEFDIGCEDIMGRHGSVADGKLVIGQRHYDTVVLPPFVENLNGKTLELLEAYLSQGGTILHCGPAPVRVEGQESDRGAALARQPGFQPLDVSKAVEQLLARLRRRILDSAGSAGRRHLVPSPPPGRRRRVPVPGQHEHRAAESRRDPRGRA